MEYSDIAVEIAKNNFKALESLVGNNKHF